MTTNSASLRVVAIACASGLVIASSGFGSVYAYKVGIEHSPLLAGLSVLMALALEGVKPLAVSGAIRQRSIALAILGLVCITYSLTAELSLMASSRGDLVAHREAIANRATEVAETKERLSEEFKTIGSVRPQEAIQAQIDAILSDKRLKRCEGTISSHWLRDICLTKVVPLKGELAKAQRRAEIARELNGLQTMQLSSIKVADPGSTALATYLGSLGFEIPISILSQWLTLVPVLALEIGSALALLVIPARVPRSVVQEASEHVQTNQMPTMVGEVATKEDASTAILEALRASNGTLQGSERQLARSIGADRSTTRRAIKSLVGAGLIAIEGVSKQGTILRIIA